MRRHLAEINYPEHGNGVTLPRIVLVMEEYATFFRGVDLKKYLDTKNIQLSYRSFKYGKIPHRGMTTISFPDLNKKLDFPYPRNEKLNAIIKSLHRSHKNAAR